MAFTGKFKTLLCGATLALAAISSASAAEWKFAVEESPGDVQTLYAEEFKRLIEERTGGKTTVTVYTYGQLGNENDLTELTAGGAIQFSNASPGHLGTFVPEVQVLSLPYLLPESDAAKGKVLSSSPALYDSLAKDFASKGLKLFTVYPEGEMVWTTKKAVRTPEDLSDVKFRVMTSPILIEQFKLYGANPVALPWGEIYSGLQMNVIQAQVNPPFFIESAKFHEVTTHLIYTGDVEYTTTVVANADFWNGLSEQDKTMLNEVREQLQTFILAKQKEKNAAALAKMQKDNPKLTVIRLTDAEREVFRKRVKPLNAKLVEMVGGRSGKILEQLQADVAAASK
ncbi:TRAP transporter substrate-binding protein DctP [Denitromonas ohlonensis]|uniref:C4-dicarboxylate ABC transporter n=2 Tax=Denitromonas TaxID=139331 RepID=A0A557R255_9RHOO|nr:TRAP transporter substrate-binding protein DctP [Denitromonas ohlonensis]TVT50459.1 MAG: C4-dicarboxylate ABC transporter [Denitromonas halophila]TVO59206.1 C4-dicarboxylate ABC transporter [Denitromonas ohlonensis]TVO73403.1 C4-dicarboxylate ABC transporter [Denitromonas ohlonensis]TVT72818.1 MAG: C4-dicarboxylate ABC transporter [Denitromonas halophila]TVT74627.1 MAG: C4-dicarboxylate ABC transporter [Denitromonas halophila]